jgi:hypothetical protein
MSGIEKLRFLRRLARDLGHLDAHRCEHAVPLYVDDGRSQARRGLLMRRPPASRLQRAAVEFGSALAEAFWRHSGVIFLALLALFSLLINIWAESGGVPVDAISALGDINYPLLIVTFGLYGLVGLLFGVLIWVGVPALILAFFVTLSKFTNRD